MMFKTHETVTKKKLAFFFLFPFEAILFNGVDIIRYVLRYMKCQTCTTFRCVAMNTQRANTNIKKKNLKNSKLQTMKKSATLLEYILYDYHRWCETKKTREYPNAKSKFIILSMIRLPGQSTKELPNAKKKRTKIFWMFVNRVRPSTTSNKKKNKWHARRCKCFDQFLHHCMIMCYFIFDART